MREEAGLTQEQMARRLGVSRPSYTRLESGGQNTTLKTLDVICRRLGCDIGDLFQGKVRLGTVRRRM
jgi:DNA-binding XRE family transcriptional regulator